MKKLLAVAVAAVGVVWAYKRSQADHAEADLWAEATDSVAAEARRGT